MHNKDVKITLYFAILVLLIAVGCAPATTPPGPEMTAGVYVDVAYQYFYWQQGLRVMIWHDSIQASNCDSSGSTSQTTHIVRCQAASAAGQHIDWTIETSDGISGEFAINDQVFDLSAGSVFLVTTVQDPLEIRQLQRDLTGIKPDSVSVTDFGLQDPEIAAFIQPVDMGEAELEPTTSVPDAEVVDPVSPVADEEILALTMAYLGLDGNVWMLGAGDEAQRQVTFDANPIDGSGTAVDYESLHLSTDGIWLAYIKNVGIPSTAGYDFTSEMWVLNLADGEQRLVMDSRPADMDWKPNTHILAFGTGVEANYFTARGESDPTLAAGLRAIDLDNGKSFELVAPERGYTLYDPQWSPDGRFLAFAEVIYLEGSGLFAYYDFDRLEYIAWDEAVGRVSWSPDGNLLAYARYTYIANGEERLYLRSLQGEEQLVGPDFDGPAYAVYPTFSPAGGQIAYLAYLDGPEQQTASINILELSSGETRSLGEFENVWEIAWSPDGSQVIFSFGPMEARQIVAVNVSDNQQTVLAAGSHPVLAGK